MWSLYSWVQKILFSSNPLSLLTWSLLCNTSPLFPSFLLAWQWWRDAHVWIHFIWYCKLNRVCRCTHFQCSWRQIWWMGFYLIGLLNLKWRSIGNFFIWENSLQHHNLLVCLFWKNCHILCQHFLVNLLLYTLWFGWHSLSLDLKHLSSLCRL